MVNRKKSKAEEGFSLLEVLIVILMVTGFLLGVLQGIVLASLLKVQAEDKNNALKWIEQDMELIRYEAFILDRASGSYTPDTTTCDSSDYEERLRQELLGTSNHPPTANPPDSGTTFPASQLDITIAGNPYDIYRDYTTSSPSDNNLEITYTVVYNSDHPRYKSNDPYTHGTSPNTNTNIVTSLLTEVMPNAALDCS